MRRRFLASGTSGALNWQKGRAPTNQGFDEWYGIPMTSNEAQTTTMPNFNPATMEAPYIWEGKAGEPSRKVKVFDLDSRRTVDREAAERGVAFMERNVRANRPFFLYYPITQIHFPTLAHPDFAGKTGAGDIGDAMADVDYNIGLVLDAIKRLGIERNTIVIWCTDNGAEHAAALARFFGPVEWLLQHGDGRRDPNAVHHSLAGPDSCRAGVE